MRKLLNILIDIKEYLDAKRLKKFLRIAPIILWVLLSSFDLYIDFGNVSDADYWNIYFDAIEILQIGVIGNIIILVFLFVYKFCWYNKTPMFGLLLLNFVNLYFTTGEESDEMFVLYEYVVKYVIIFFTSILTIRYLIRKV